ncbi:MAG TPA: hypothetical protein VGK61_05020 [Planctomycetota bacterium]|jgi:hypothetical protein
MSRFRDRIAKAALVLGVFGSLAPPVAAALLSAASGRNVILVATPNNPDIVEANRALWTPGEPVAPLYGTPVGEPMRILFADPARIIVPGEDPSLTLYTVDKAKGENPLQERTMWFAVRMAMYASGALLAAALLHSLWGRLRGPRAAVTE